jgi:hypothetical protein
VGNFARMGYTRKELKILVEKPTRKFPVGRSRRRRRTLRWILDHLLTCVQTKNK